MDKKGLRIATWNANGLLMDKQELEIFLNMQQIDICLVSQSHLTKESYLKFKSYRAYHTARPDYQAKVAAQ